MSTVANEDFANFDAKLSLNTPIEDYKKLLNDKLKADVILPGTIYNECWKKISNATTQFIWKLIFDDAKESSQHEQLNTAAEFLKLHKEDACFYGANEYNEWIVLVRDELLKRQMFDFWKNVIVANELGPCWVRDSDLFDDFDDPAPANFYKHAGCEAAWLKKKTENVAQNATNLVASSLLHKETPASDRTLKKISKETPFEDYKYNMDTQEDLSEDDDVVNQIFEEARVMIWNLLFGENVLTDENYKKAADLLEEYKRDACFYSPWDYNDWIPKVKDELVKRNYLKFWQDVVVQKSLGLCWARDSDYFDDAEDPKPLEFYKITAKVPEVPKK